MSEYVKQMLAEEPQELDKVTSPEQLTELGRTILASWKESQPKWCAKMGKKRLYKMVNDTAGAAYRGMQNALARGMSYDAAWDAALGIWMKPSEEDSPDLW